MSRAVQGLTGLILAGILIQSYLPAVTMISLYLFRTNSLDVESRQLHESTDYLLGVPILLLVIMTLCTGLRWRDVGGVALLGALFVGQVMVARVQLDPSYIPALYAMNGMVMLGLTAALDHSQEVRHIGPTHRLLVVNNQLRTADHEVTHAEPALPES